MLNVKVGALHSGWGELPQGLFSTLLLETYPFILRATEGTSEFYRLQDGCDLLKYLSAATTRRIFKKYANGPKDCARYRV